MASSGGRFMEAWCVQGSAMGSGKHHRLKAGFHVRSFRIEDAEVNGAPDAVGGRDHVIAEGAFLARTDAQDCGARAFV
jgi:hypothetical protein